MSRGGSRRIARPPSPDPDPNAGRIRCLICQEWYWALSSHLNRRHHVTSADYREEYGAAPLVSPSVVARQTRWTRAAILGVLKSRIRAGLPMNAKAVSEDPNRGGMWGAIFKRFGSFEAALEAAGLNYEKIRLVHAWTREKVIQGLREAKWQGRELNFKAVKRWNDSLVEAAVRWFGAYDEALRAAGFDPDRVRKQRVWTAGDVLEALKARQRSGRPLSHRALIEEDAGLRSSAVHHFGNYRNAIEAAGIQYEKISLRRRWNRRKIVEALRERADRGLPLHYKAVAREDLALVGAAAVWFGSYEKAVRAAGFDYRKVRRVHPWTPAQVLAGIQARSREGKSLAHKATRMEENPLCVHAHQHFGSWEAAIQAAGFDYEKIREYQSWSALKVVTLLRRYAREGIRVTQKDMVRRDPNLASAAARHLGSWSAAVRRAGFTPLPRGRTPNGWMEQGRSREQGPLGSTPSARLRKGGRDRGSAEAAAEQEG